MLHRRKRKNHDWHRAYHCPAKGWIWKTTLAINLAIEALYRGKKVAVVDTDPQGSLGRWFMTRIDELGALDLELSTA